MVVVTWLYNSSGIFEFIKVVYITVRCQRRWMQWDQTQTMDKLSFSFISFLLLSLGRNVVGSDWTNTDTHADVCSLQFCCCKHASGSFSDQTVHTALMMCDLNANKPDLSKKKTSTVNIEPASVGVTATTEAEKFKYISNLTLKVIVMCYDCTWCKGRKPSRWVEPDALQRQRRRLSSWFLHLWSSDIDGAVVSFCRWSRGDGRTLHTLFFLYISSFSSYLNDFFLNTSHCSHTYAWRVSSSSHEVIISTIGGNFDPFLKLKYSFYQAKTWRG